MQRIIVCSDVHGFYDELMKALEEVNFNPEKDLFISLGDNIDRGPKPKEVIDFILSLPKKVLVKGNHCSLFEEFCERGYPLGHDIHNGTADTILLLSPEAQKWDEACHIAMENMKPLLDQMVDYYETEHYVFCHGYVPCNKRKDWREATPSQWEDARWLNGMEMDMNGYTIDKCVISGHYHTSWGHHMQDGSPEFGEGADFSPYYGDGVIAIDACTAYSGKVNVLVLEDEFLDEEF